MRAISIDPSAFRRIARPAESLRSRVMTGSLWTLIGYVGGQGLRFVSNAILTHLLFPEAFGLMALVNTVVIGLEMFSDVGTRASLIQNHRGEDDIFRRTAFTVNAVRGVGLWGAAALLSYPLSSFFGEPELAKLLPVASVSAAILGLRSTKALLASRKLDLARLTLLTLGSQAVTIAVMVPWAFIEPSVWALVGGTVVGAIAQTVGSHILFPGARDRFGWDRDAADELFRFGRWIFASTALAYLAGQGDTLLMGHMMNAAELGVFTVASNIARVAGQGLNQLGNSVLFPAYARVFRETPERIDQVLLKSRSILMGVGAAVYIPVILLGDFVIDLVYDDRYQAAGWMLQTMACGFLTGLLDRSYNGILHAKGMSFESTVLQFFQVLIKFACMVVGYYFMGLPGLIIGVAFNAWLSYPIVAIVMGKAGVWQPRLDAIALVMAAVVTLLFALFPPAGLLTPVL